MTDSFQKSHSLNPCAGAQPNRSLTRKRICWKAYQTITWDNTNPVGDVWARLAKSGVWLESIGSAPRADGQMSWEICPYIGDGADYKISISSCDCGPCVSDSTDTPFEIVGSLPWPTLLGDFDANDVVDLGDFSQLTECTAGSDLPWRECDCALFDFDCDEDVDLRDFGRFQNGFSSEGIPADPTCPN